MTVYVSVFSMFERQVLISTTLWLRLLDCSNASIRISKSFLVSGLRHMFLFQVMQHQVSASARSSLSVPPPPRFICRFLFKLCDFLRYSPMSRFFLYTFIFLCCSLKMCLFTSSTKTSNPQNYISFCSWGHSALRTLNVNNSSTCKTLI